MQSDVSNKSHKRHPKVCRIVYSYLPPIQMKRRHAEEMRRSKDELKGDILPWTHIHRHIRSDLVTSKDLLTSDMCGQWMQSWGLVNNDVR